jgi:hypothetical protein
VAHLAEHSDESIVVEIPPGAGKSGIIASLQSILASSFSDKLVHIVTSNAFLAEYGLEQYSFTNSMGLYPGEGNEDGFYLSVNQFVSMKDRDLETGVFLLDEVDAQLAQNYGGIQLNDDRYKLISPFKRLQSAFKLIGFSGSYSDSSQLQMRKLAGERGIIRLKINPAIEYPANTLECVKVLRQIEGDAQRAEKQELILKMVSEDIA